MFLFVSLFIFGFNVSLAGCILFVVAFVVVVVVACVIYNMQTLILYTLNVHVMLDQLLVIRVLLLL